MILSVKTALKFLSSVLPQNIKHRYVKKYQILYLPVNFVNSSVEINIQTTMKTKDEGDCGFISYFSQFSSIFYLQKLKMINIEIKIKVAAAGGDYSKLQLQTWHQSTPITC